MEDSTKVNQFVLPDSDEEDQQQQQDHMNGSQLVKTSLEPLEKDKLDSGSLDNGSGISSCSSPMPQEPFQPRYKARILPKAVSVTKDGDVIIYTINSQRLLDHVDFTVKRQYEDFEYLDHCLSTAVLPGDGVIFPPLPPKAAITAEETQEKSKEKLGKTSKVLIAGEWHKDCFHLQEYLKLMLNHTLFGRNNDVWDKFLAAKDPLVRVNVKKAPSIMSKITESFDGKASKSSHKDFDEYFQKERDFVQLYTQLTKESSEAFNATIYARLSKSSFIPPAVI